MNYLQFSALQLLNTDANNNIALVENEFVKFILYKIKASSIGETLKFQCRYEKEQTIMKIRNSTTITLGLCAWTTIKNELVNLGYDCSYSIIDRSFCIITVSL